MLEPFRQPSPIQYEPNRYRNLQSYVMHQLGRLIVGGIVRPGDTLPTEPELAEQFDVGKSVVREATRGLAAKGLVRSRPRIGTLVRPQDEWHMLDPEVLSWHLHAPQATAFLSDLEEFRGAIEPMSARLSAINGTDDDRREIRVALQEMADNVGDKDAYFASDVKLHLALLSATRNRLFIGLAGAIESALTVRHRVLHGYIPSMSESFPFHEAVVAAVEAGDSNAAYEAMLSLLDLTVRDDSALHSAKTASTDNHAADSIE